MYRGEKKSEWFVEQLKIECRRFSEILKLHGEKQMIPSSADEEIFHNSQTRCTVCEEEFSEANPKTHHHDHFTGIYISSYCRNCNTQCKTDNSVRVILHNLSNYDSHLFIEELAKYSAVNIIPLTLERYISFSAFIGDIKLIFLDSFRFLPTTLEELSANLENHQFKYIRQYFSNDCKFDLVKTKGVFPYDCINHIDKFRETRLPDKKYFYNRLKQTDISDADYNHAENVWKTFKIKNLEENNDLYLCIDVLLLTDVFENFRDLTMLHYRLNAAAFYTAPGLSWAAALKFTKVILELLQDPNMISFVENAIRLEWLEHT